MATDSLPRAAPSADRRREQRGWYLYDWANSAFSTTVLAVFLGPYLTGIAQSAADARGFVHPFGIPVYADSLWAYLGSLSVGLQVLFLPVLGALADTSRRKKQFLGVFAYVGALATLGLYFVDGGRYLLGAGLFLAANLSFGAALVFYNAFLPEIATPDERDTVSSRGWAMGYLGGGILLAANLVLFTRHEALGLTTGEAVRVSLASAGAWWALFTVVPLVTLRMREPARTLQPGERLLTVGFRQLGRTLRGLPAYPQTLLFLAAYLLYNDGVQTVILLLSQFGQEELGLDLGTLTRVILMVQFVAFLGALAFGALARRIGTKRAILISLVVWVGGTVFAYGPLDTPGEFWAVAAVGALVLGGTQALSRSAFSQMIPRGREAEYFSLYEVSERGTSWLGPLLFGLVLQATTSYRLGILSLVVFFTLGAVLLLGVDLRRAAVEAGNVPPSSA